MSISPMPCRFCDAKDGDFPSPEIPLPTPQRCWENLTPFYGSVSISERSLYDLRMIELTITKKQENTRTSFTCVPGCLDYLPGYVWTHFRGCCPVLRDNLRSMVTNHLRIEMIWVVVTCSMCIYDILLGGLVGLFKRAFLLIEIRGNCGFSCIFLHLCLVSGWGGAITFIPLHS